MTCQPKTCFWGRDRLAVLIIRSMDTEGNVCMQSLSQQLRNNNTHKLMKGNIKTKIRNTKIKTTFLNDPRCLFLHLKINLNKKSFHISAYQTTCIPMYVEAYIGQLMCWWGTGVMLVFLVPLLISGLEPTARPLRHNKTPSFWLVFCW